MILDADDFIEATKRDILIISSRTLQAKKYQEGLTEQDLKWIEKLYKELSKSDISKDAKLELYFNPYTGFTYKEV